MRPLTASPVETLSGVLRVPGDKSISHRALMLAALAVGETVITGLLEGEDVLGTAAAMRALGAEMTRDDEGSWHVWGRGLGGLSEPEAVIDLGNSGTGARLLAGILASHPLTATLSGDASLCRRPMARVVEPLSLIGARFHGRAGHRLPMTIVGSGDPLPISYRLPVASAQVKSAVLLAGLNAPGITEVVEPQPTRDHSERMLRHFGAQLSIEESDGGRLIRLVGQPELTACPLAVPADPSSAAFATVAAAVLPGSRIVLQDVGINPLRAGLYVTLVEMGAAISFENRREVAGEPVADLVIEGGELQGVEVPESRAPSMIDEYPILAVAAACARGTTVMRGLAELRVKESDRLAAVLRGLAVCGVEARAEGDTLIVEGCAGRPPGGSAAAIVTDLDHRIAMSFLVLGLAAEKAVTVDDAAPIETSFPGFVALMNGLGAQIAQP